MGFGWVVLMCFVVFVFLFCFVCLHVVVGGLCVLGVRFKAMFVMLKNVVVLKKKHLLVSSMRVVCCGVFVRVVRMCCVCVVCLCACAI